MSRRLLLVSAALVFAILLTGCPKSAPPIQLIIRDGPEASAMQVVAHAFEQKTRIPVEIRILGRDTYLHAVRAQLLSHDTDIDICFVPSSMIGALASAGALEPLETFIKSDADLFATYGLGGHTFGLPTDISTFFLYYRSDLIPNPPATWQELRQVAAQYTRSLNNTSPTAYGLGFSGKGPEEPPKVFYPILWSFGGDVIADQVVTIDRPAAHQAAEYYQELLTSGVAAPDLVTWSYPDVVKALENGSIAMAAPMWNAAYYDILKGPSRFRHVIKVAPLPGTSHHGLVSRTNFQHAWTLVVSSHSPHKADAAQFVAFATGRNGGRIYALAGGTPARKSILDDPALQARRPDFRLLSQMLLVSRPEAVLVERTAIHDVLTVMLHDLLTRQHTPTEATAAAANSLRRVTGLP
jgi:multiple sugar transport system substrate-binding protein